MTFLQPGRGKQEYWGWALGPKDQQGPLCFPVLEPPAISSLRASPLPPSLPQPAQPGPCSVERHIKPYCPLGAGAEPFCCSAPRRVRVTQLIKTILF